VPDYHHVLPPTPHPVSGAAAAISDRGRKHVSSSAAVTAVTILARRFNRAYNTTSRIVNVRLQLLEPSPLTEIVMTSYRN
jgi:hypothetical protein